MDALEFRHPIRNGDIVTLRGRVNRSFKSSMEVEVEVLAEPMTVSDAARRHALSRAHRRAWPPPSPLAGTGSETPLCERFADLRGPGPRSQAVRRQPVRLIVPATQVPLAPQRSRSRAVSGDAHRGGGLGGSRTAPRGAPEGQDAHAAGGGRAPARQRPRRRKGRLAARCVTLRARALRASRAHSFPRLPVSVAQPACQRRAPSRSLCTGSCRSTPTR